MKGLIFGLLEQAVVDTLGEATWEAALDAVDSTGVYRAHATYDDGELVTLIGVVADRHFGGDADAALRWFGRELITRLADRYPAMVGAYDSTESLLRGLNDHIHAQVQTMYPDATLPYFEFNPPEAGMPRPGELVLAYRSQRPLEALAEGMIAAVAARLGEPLTLTRRPGANGRSLFVCDFSQPYA